MLFLQRKAVLNMRLKTRNLTLRIRAVLLELPDRVFLKTLLDWISMAEEQLQFPDWSDEYRYTLGFRVQSLETQTIYATFNALHENEPGTINASWVEPGISTLRSILKNFTLEQFYRTIIPLASDALFERAVQEHWGPPPSSLNNGHDFLENLLRHLEAKVYRRADQLRLPISPDSPDDIPASEELSDASTASSDPPELPIDPSATAEHLP
jgi:hypothetical protein